MSQTIIILLLFITAAAVAADNVLDITGKPLISDTGYYILPVIRGRGGGLTMKPKNATSPCPLFAAQENQEVSLGKPVKFYPVNYPTQTQVDVSSDLNFVFSSFATVCAQSTGWKLTLDDATARRYVGLGVVTAPPGPASVSNWFKIEKAGTGRYDYKIVFCPSVCNFCKVFCGDIGVFFGDAGRRLLGFSGQPFLVMFKKA